MSSTPLNSTTRRRLALPALVLASALALAACGDDGGNDTASTGSSSSGEHGGGHSGADKDEAQGNDADVAFLTGMKPHHAQAVEMSDIVLQANPPAEVAAIAQRIKDAQEPEIRKMDTMLQALGEQTDGGAHDGHSSAHGGMMSAEDLAELEAATGTEAARLYLTAMIAHHEGAIEASDRQIAEGQYEPAVELAAQIRTAQQAEITEMRALLERL